MKQLNTTTLFRISVLLIFLLGSAGYVNAQTVSGRVFSDVDNSALQGARVIVKGTQQGAMTDAAGRYSVKAAANSVLEISFVGFKTQEVDVRDRTSVDVEMQTATLDEVVVVGYGSQKRSDLTGAVASISSDDIVVMPVPTFDLALQGRAAGMLITSTSGEPGGGVSIRIRGSNSVLGSNEPLIVLDGYPLPEGGEASNDGSNNNRGQVSNLLSFLNPAEIESVEILKDASATAIYGSRGANGVILVTTKKGISGRPQINVTSESGWNEIPDFPELMDGPTYAQWRNDLAEAGGTALPFDGVARPLPQNVTTTRWVDRILRNGFNQRIQADASGGTDKVRYFVAGNYLENNGLLKFTKFQRGNIRANLDVNLSKRLTLSSSINYTRSLNNRSEEGTGLIINSGAIFTAYKNSPAASPDDPLDEGDGLTNFFADPLVQLRDTRDQTFNENTIISLLGTYNILEGLDFNVRTGTSAKNSSREIFWPSTTRVGQLVNRRAINNSFNYRDLLLETYLSYNKSLGEHNLNLVGGYSFQDNTERRLNVRVEDFPTDVLETDAIGLGLDPFIPTSSRIARRLSSFYLRTNYNYKSKYYLTFSGRADGSSVFAANNKWGFFPSAAIGWTISNEDFMENIPQVTNLKLRASYGITGTQSIPPLGSLTLLGTANAAIGDILNAGLAPNVLGNPNLKWEETAQLNIGLDFELFGGRLYGNLDYYNKETNDLLQRLPLPTSAGLTSIFANVGIIQNKGIEIMIGGYPVDGRNFKWNTDLNWSRNEATVKDLGVTAADIFGPAPAVNIVNLPANIMREGEIFGAMYGFNVIGLIQESDLDDTGAPLIPIKSGISDPGSWKFEDIDGDGVITNNDREIIGDPTPDFIFGWNNNFTYKNFTLSVFFQGVVGNDVMNLDRLFLASGRSVNNALLSWYEGRWTEENPHNLVRFPGSNGQNSLQPNSAVVEDGSYVRLKNASLGYSLPSGWLSKIGMRQVRIYATGTNLFTITNYSGFDPEINIFGGNNIGQGIDFASYPRQRTYTLGVNVGL